MLFFEDAPVEARALVAQAVPAAQRADGGRALVERVVGDVGVAALVDGERAAVMSPSADRRGW